MTANISARLIGEPRHKSCIAIAAGVCSSSHLRIMKVATCSGVMALAERRLDYFDKKLSTDKAHTETQYSVYEHYMVWVHHYGPDKSPRTAKAPPGPDNS